MKSIKNSVTTQIIINKSKFYTELIPLNSIDEIDDYLKEIEKKYKDATHYCYAYIFDQTKRFSDDGEPGGTAGMPILNVLESNNLDHVLAVVIRYFGGIKLGAGGLVRAYTNSVVEAINNSTVVTLNEGYIIELIFPYNEEKNVNYILKDKEILNKEYNELIKYTLFISKSDIDIISKYEYKIIKETIGF